MSAERATILELPQGDRAKRLKRKLDEYTQRLREIDRDPRYMAPEAIEQLRGSTEIWYAYYILNGLITAGSIDSQEIASVMRAMTGQFFDENFFRSRLGVIESYVKTGSAGGNDLPPLPDSDES